MKIDEKDVSYTYDHFGYMIQYKGQTIGGAGTLGKNNSKKLKSNLEFNRSMAELTKRDVLVGVMPLHMQKAIEKIDRNLYPQRRIIMDDAKTIAKDAIKELGEAIDLAKEIRAENATLKAINAELLEACQAVLSGNIDHGTFWQVDIDDINQIKAAINKAKGGS